jgi:hypothetical protein
MAVVDSSLQLGYKNSSWFTTNSTLVLLVGQIVYLEQTGTYKLGDGVTQLSDLSFLGGLGSGLTDGLLSGGIISKGTFGGAGLNNDVRVSPTTWSISSAIYITSSNTNFLDIAFSATGLQRFIGFYANTSNSIIKVEGVQGQIATYPSTPINTIVIGYILVSDAGLAPISFVQSVTGLGIDNTDPLNPIINTTLGNALTNGNTTGGNNIEVSTGDKIVGGTGEIDFYNETGVALTSDNSNYGLPYVWVDSIDSVPINKPQAGLYDDTSQRYIRIVKGTSSDVSQFTASGVEVFDDKTDIRHNVKNEFNAPDNNINGNLRLVAVSNLVNLNVNDSGLYVDTDNGGGLESFIHLTQAFLNLVGYNGNNSLSIGQTKNALTHDTLNEFSAPNNNFPNETASKIAVFDASKNLKSADTSTYPNLTELSYLKGVTSSIQTQLDKKLFTISFETGSFNPADATTYYFSDVRVAPNTTQTNFSFNLGYGYTIIGVKIGVGLNTTTGTTELSTLKIRNITQSTSSTCGTFGSDGSTTLIKSTTITGLSINVASGDAIAAQWDTPTWTTNPVAPIIFVTLICKPL